MCSNSSPSSSSLMDNRDLAQQLDFGGEINEEAVRTLFKRHQFAQICSNESDRAAILDQLCGIALRVFPGRGADPVPLDAIYDLLLDSISPEVPNQNAEAWAAYIASYVAVGNGSLEKAKIWLQKSLLSSTSDIHKFEASELLMEVYYELRDSSNCIEMGKMLVDSAERSKHQQYHAKALFLLAGAFMQLSRYEEGRLVLDDLQKLAAPSHDPLINSFHLKLQGTICQYLGQYADSIRFNEQAIQLFKQSGPLDPSFQSSIHRYICGAEQEIYDAKVSLADAAVLLSESSENLVLRLEIQTRIAWRDKNLEDAESYAGLWLQKAVSSVDICNALVWIAKISEHYLLQRESGSLDPGHVELVESLYEEAEDLSDPRNQRIHLNSHGKFLLACNRYEKAIQKFQNCLRNFLEVEDNFGSDSEGRISYMETVKDCFRNMQLALSFDGSETEIWRGLVWAERERARDLLYRISSSAEADAYLNDLTTFDRDDSKALEEIQSICKDAGEETVFLVYSKTVVSLQSYFLHMDDPVQMSYTDIDSIDVFKAFNSVIEIKGEDELKFRGLQNIYDRLIRPWLDKLEEIQPSTIVIVPVEEVSLVPFAALYNVDDDSYLVQKYATVCIPSLRMFRHCEQQWVRAQEKSLKETALVVGNPDGSLKGAEEEAEFVRDTLEGDFKRVMHLQQGQALKKAILDQLASSDWVHIATHAVVSQEFPSGALLCASDVLKIEEVEEERWGLQFNESIDGKSIEGLGRRMRASCIVLSACESGLGQLLGEGVLGLLRPLHMLGVPSVVASLWRVNDDTGKEFMKKFYTNLKEKKSLAFALKDAVLESMEDDFGNPSSVEDWAPFFLSGSPNVSLL